MDVLKTTFPRLEKDFGKTHDGQETETCGLRDRQTNLLMKFAMRCSTR